jgi:hypothetical protein
MTGAIASLILSVALAIATPLEAAEYESAPVLDAPAVLPPEILEGPHYRVDDNVKNDGYLNTYRLRSDYGEFDVYSTALLKIRAHEINAIAALMELEQTDEFQDSLKKSGQEFGEGVKRLVEDPKGTLKGAGSGIKNMFNRAGEAFRSERSETEDAQYKSLIGFSTIKREYAAEFGVDPYSSNGPLQAQLDKIAGAALGGSLTVTVAKMLVPGAAGLAVSAASATTLMNDLITQQPPTELRMINREKLLAMDVHPDVAELLINNTVYSPSQATYLVGSLAQMKGTAARDVFIKYAIPVSEEDLAFFRTRTARSYAGFDRNVEPIARFVGVGDRLGAVTKRGDFVAIVPVDHIVWTESVARLVDSYEGDLGEDGKTRTRSLWVSGTVSPKAREEFEKRGWTVHDNSENRLLGSD